VPLKEEKDVFGFCHDGYFNDIETPESFKEFVGYVKKNEGVSAR